MKILIRHRTHFTYEAPVSFGDHHIFLRPRDTHLLRVEDFSVETVPAGRQRWVRDVFNNIVLVTNFGLETSAVLEFDCRMTVESLENNPFDFVLEPYAVGFPFAYSERDRVVLAPSIDTPVAGSERVLDWVTRMVRVSGEHPDVVAFLNQINAGIREGIAYERRDEEGIRTPDETLELGSGSCRDMALLFMAICRRLGLAARYVSGYLREPPEDEASGTRFNRAAGSMHAWVEIYLPGAGWKGFDPTNGVLADGLFIPSAVAVDPAAIDPIQGRYFASGPVKSAMEVSLDVR